MINVDTKANAKTRRQNNKSHSINRRLIEITREIEELTLEMNALLKNDGCKRNKTQHSVRPVVGDRVVITNNHKSLQGSKGYIIRSTAKQYTINLDNGNVINRAKTNVKLINEKEQ